jgi:hypothetical protein
MRRLLQKLSLKHGDKGMKSIKIYIPNPKKRETQKGMALSVVISTRNFSGVE